MKRLGLQLLVTVALGAVSLLPNMQTALAAPPSNDHARRATEINQLPFVQREDTSDARADGPRRCSNNSSVFFKYTATEDLSLQADTMGSDYEVVLTVLAGSPHNFKRIACNIDEVDADAVSRFDAKAGTTYYFEVATCCGSGEDNTGGKLEFALSQVFTGTPEVTVTLDRRATLHPGRLVRVSGTVSCNERLEVEVYGSLRQLNGDFVARGFFDRYPPVTCGPGKAKAWKAYVDTETGVAFREGFATSLFQAYASNGYESQFVDRTRARVQIVQP
jgi:hypothetical protein